MLVREYGGADESNTKRLVRGAGAVIRLFDLPAFWQNVA
jgi:hypothetical protein